MSKKKSNNPFKMAGPWIGAIVTPIMIFFNTLNIYSLTHELCPLDTNGVPMPCMADPYSLSLIYVLIAIPIGFLVGWGIQSLIRRFK
jgi:hypothetical protein